MAKKRTAPVGVEQKNKVKCTCGGNCKYIKQRILQDMDTKFCNKYYHILSYTKIE